MTKKNSSMTVKQIYDLSIKMGIKADFRGGKEIQKLLKRTKEKFGKLSDEQKKEFDQERLMNPYSDTRILNDLPNKKIKKILTGIDMEPAEMLLAKQIGDIDLVLAHHPEGKSLASLDDVMHLQADVLHQYGVPINIAEGVLRERISEVSRGISAINHNRAVDAARILGLGFMNVHTPADNLAASFLNEKIKKDKPEYVGDILKSLKEISEYQEAIKIGAGPRLFTGSEDNRAGKIALTELTGGTSGSAKMYEKMAQAGIGTIIGMHMSEQHKKEAEKHNINVVIAGHISSDSLGMNLFLDELEKKGIEIIPCSGLIRVKRFKK